MNGRGRSRHGCEKQSREEHALATAPDSLRQSLGTTRLSLSNRRRIRVGDPNDPETIRDRSRTDRCDRRDRARRC
jgi:hypothetical protein